MRAVSGTKFRLVRYRHSIAELIAELFLLTCVPTSRLQLRKT